MSYLRIIVSTSHTPMEYPAPEGSMRGEESVTLELEIEEDGKNQEEVDYMFSRFMDRLDAYGMLHHFDVIGRLMPDAGATLSTETDRED